MGIRPIFALPALLTVAAVCLDPAASAPAPAPAPDHPAIWSTPLAPFRIAGNIYYVGTAGLPVYLVTDPRGDVLIDGTMEETAPLVAANIERLGFRMRDVEYLLIDHAHWDHAGGLAQLQRLSGAKLVASAGDAPALESGRPSYRPDTPPWPPVHVDRIVADRATVRVGRTVLTAHLTPGHTRGCTSWTTNTAEGRRRLSVIFACSLTVAGQKLVGDDGYPQAAADFERSFARLRRLRADIFLTFHVEPFGLDAKRSRLLRGDKLAFVDPREMPAQIAKAQRAFREELARQRTAAALPQLHGAGPLALPRERNRP